MLKGSSFCNLPLTYNQFIRNWAHENHPASYLRGEFKISFHCKWRYSSTNPIGIKQESCWGRHSNIIFFHFFWRVSLSESSLWVVMKCALLLQSQIWCHQTNHQDVKFCLHLGSHSFYHSSLFWGMCNKKGGKLTHFLENLPSERIEKRNQINSCNSRIVTPPKCATFLLTEGGLFY